MLRRLLTLIALFCAVQAIADDRPAAWAQPIERPGLPNLHQVSDSLYRSAQPSS